MMKGFSYPGKSPIKQDDLGELLYDPNNPSSSNTTFPISDFPSIGSGWSDFGGTNPWAGSGSSTSWRNAINLPSSGFGWKGMTNWTLGDKHVGGDMLGRPVAPGSGVTGQSWMHQDYTKRKKKKLKAGHGLSRGEEGWSSKAGSYKLANAPS